MTTTPQKILAILATLAATFSLASAVTAATVPYSNDFESTNVGSIPDGWSTTGSSTSADWQVADDNGNHVYEVSSDTNGNTASILELTNVEEALSGFIISVTFTVTDELTSIANEYIGFASYGNNSSLSAYYLADIRGNGSIRVISIGSNSSSFTTGTSTNLSTGLVEGVTYTMTSTGVYTEDGDLELTLTVTDGTHTAVASGVDSSPRTGDYFGLRVNNASTNDTLTVQFDNYEVTAIPEANSTALALGIIAGLSFLWMKRRR